MKNPILLHTYLLVQHTYVRTHRQQQSNTHTYIGDDNNKATHIYIGDDNNKAAHIYIGDDNIKAHTHIYI